MINRDWKCTLRITPNTTRLLVTAEHGDVLKARFLPPPAHPRAALTLLEGLSLWMGRPPLPVALSVDARCLSMRASTHLGDEYWPGDSPLVRFEVAARDRRSVPLSGLGDFRLEREIASWTWT